jgi:photosystem II stability/assembly factor-like uncharacterized protein
LWVSARCDLSTSVSRLKGGISAAIAIAAALLLASGYLLTIARLESKGLPTDSMLAALPTSFYVGTAVHTAWLPLSVALSAAAIWALIVARSPAATMPSRLQWGVGLFALAGYSIVASQVLYGRLLDDAPGAFYGRVGLALVGFFVVGFIARAVAAELLRATPHATPAIRTGLAVSAILVLSVLAAVGFRAITVRYLPNAIVQALVEEDPSACPVPKGARKPPSQGCGDSGFYLGESDAWVYLVDQPAEAACDQPTNTAPNELVEIAKSEVHRVVLYKEPPPEEAGYSAPHCPYPPNQHGPAPQVIAAELSNGGHGWSLTSDGLWRTDDAGQHWESIEPPGVDPTAIASAEFSDSQHGIAVVGEPEEPEVLRPVVYATSDGGSSWTSHPLPARPPLGKTSISSSEEGKVVHVLVTSPSIGTTGVSELYVSDDEGTSWEPVGPTPEKGDIGFTSAEEGWLAGASGTNGEGLFRTDDGGRSWQLVSVKTPPGVGELGTSYSLPSISSDGTGVLPVTFNGDFGHTAVGVYVTSDSGEEWALARLVPLKGSIGPGGEPNDVSFVGPMALDIMDPGYPGFTEVNLEEGVFETAEGVESGEQAAADVAVEPALEAETEADPVATSDLPAGLNPIAFAENEEVAFSVEDASRCEGAKSCPVPNELLVSRDGGVTWNPVTPP